MMTKREIETRVAALVGKLPPMPGTLDRLLEDLPSLSPENLERLVLQDPGLCAELLRLANTCGGTERRVATVGEALRAVGPEAFAQYAGISFAHSVIHQDFAGVRHLPQYFAHSREIALTCRALAEIAGLPLATCELYSVAGLIHDIGRLVMLIATDDWGAQLMGTTADQMLAIVRDEERLAGLNHCDIGMQICTQWNFTPLLNEGVLRHHTPKGKDDFSRPGAMIFLAHFVGSSDFTGEIISRIVPPSLFQELGLAPQALLEARRLYDARVQAVRPR